MIYAIIYFVLVLIHIGLFYSFELSYKFQLNWDEVSGDILLAFIFTVVWIVAIFLFIVLLPIKIVNFIKDTLER